jgi:NAD(P)H-dependent flavin oxidoreductase YrpB (nitropropane dioxygenase family)
MEMFETESAHHGQYHDNMFCHSPEETVAFMQSVKVPWIAFKILAAGAIPPEEGFKYAFDNGADFICVGMFDFQVRQDAALARQAIVGARNRKRPWTTSG